MRLLAAILMAMVPAQALADVSADLGACVPYLQDGRPGRVTIVWRDAKPMAGKVEVAEQGGPTVFTRNDPVAAQHEVVVDGLTPGGRYTYRVTRRGPDRRPLVDEGRIRVNRGPQAVHLRFAAIADCGTGSPAQYAVAKQMVAWKPDLVIAAGDLVYPNGAAKDYAPHFFAPYAELMRSTVIYPALGNHDVRSPDAAPYRAVFVVPGEAGGERFYAFDDGPVRFWALDSNQPMGPGSPQYEWLLADASASKSPWKVAFFHHPPYSSGLHGSSMAIRDAVGPAFERLGFALVVTGHDHHYERSKPQGGVTYIVTGGGGGWPYNANPRDHAAKVVNTFEFAAFTVYRDTMALQAIDLNGKVIDAATITRR